MADQTIQCPNCGAALAYDDEQVGMVLSCPSCSAEFELAWPDDEEDAETATGAAVADDAAGLPERMRANRQVEGRTCTECGNGIHFGEDVHNCPTCGQTAHESCWQQVGGCPSCTGGQGDTAGSDGPQLPERMRANRQVEGRTCTKCGNGIHFGEDVHNCPTCGQSAHERCWQEQGGCPNCVKSSAWPDPNGPTVGLKEEPLKLKRPAAAPPPVPVGGGGMDGEDKECRFCGEPIRAKAKKCRHCGEYQDPSVASKLRKNNDSDEDDQLGVWEWLLGIVCGGIACIVGIVWICQGKKKGWKLLLVAIISNVIWRVIAALARS